MKSGIPIIFTILCLDFSTFSNEIPIENLVRKPEIDNVSLSMDGKYVAALYIDSNDIQQLLTYNIEKNEKHIFKPDPDLDVYKYCWASNDHLVYYVSQQDGRYLCYLSSADRNLNPKTKKILLGPYYWSDILDGLLHDPDHILLQKRYSSKYILVGKMNIHKAWMRKKEKFTGELLWEMTDFYGALRLIRIYKNADKTGDPDCLYRESVSSPWRPMETAESVDYYSFTPDGAGLYISTAKTTKNSDECEELTYDEELQDYVCKDETKTRVGKTRGLFLYDLKEKKTVQTIYADPVFDFKGELHFFSNPYNPAAASLRGITQYNDTVVTVWYDKKLAALQLTLDSMLPGAVNYMYDADTSLTRFLFKSYSDSKESEYYLFDIKNRKMTLLFKSCPWINPELMSRTKPVTFQTRDNLTLHGYLTLPKAGKPPYPTVILTHGGPHVRDYWGFDSEVQVLASRGYAVFQINYRGSTGFGSIISEKEKFAYHKMYMDIVDGTHYLIKEGIADEKRIAAMGASFGGYLSICGITYEPDLYCCAISNVGVFDWKKHVRSKKFKYNDYAYDFFKTNLGGGNKDYLDSISPIHKARNIKVPVLLTGGSEDNNVMISQSTELADKLRAAGTHVETYFKAYERHGFQRQKSINEYYRRVLDFLARNMGNKRHQE